jgi:proline iminopeptidase
MPNSVAETRRININGVKQFLTIRGNDQHNPIVLWLHGGPGSLSMPYFMHYNASLEKQFTVVYWDQRGSGKSYSPRIPPASMTLDQFIADTYELTNWLKKRFQQDKVVLVGHSWGGLLGMHVVAKHPTDYSALIAVSPGVNWLKGLQLSYEFTRNTAQQKQDTLALATLNRIGKPENGFFKDESAFKLHRDILQKYGGVLHQNHKLTEIQFFLRSTEYRLWDLLKARKIRRAAAPMAKEIFPKLDLKTQIPAVKVPVYFCLGRHDYISPSELAADYYQSLQAPVKTLVWFEESAHAACWEESEKFNAFLEEILFVNRTP